MQERPKGATTMTILALDQGTTSTRAIVFDKGGQILGKAQQEFEQIFPKAGWVEHRPEDILSTAVGVIAESLIRANVTSEDIGAIGITNQRETTIVWDRKTGKPVYNAIVWQCRRTADYCDELRAAGYAPMIYEKTGLVLDAYFSATKLKWILDNVPGVRERAEAGELCFGTVDTYLMFKLSGGEIFATDYTNASRTMLFNIHTLAWDEELCKLFGIPTCMLPAVRPSGFAFGTTAQNVLGRKIPICAAVGDQQGALFGQLCTEEGDIKNTYGTGCFLLMNTGSKAVKSKNGLVTTLGAGVGNRPPYVLEGSVFIGGAVIQWLRDGLGILSSAQESEAMALSVPDGGGVYFVPAFTGLGAPYWDSHARGTIVGLTRGTGRGHIVRAALESVAFEVNDIMRAMECDAGTPIKRLAVDGGASANRFLMQFQADVSDVEVVKPKNIETTALGAAYLAGLQIGYWKDVDDIRANAETDAVFHPQMTSEKRAEILAGWENAVGRTLTDR